MEKAEIIELWAFPRSSASLPISEAERKAVER